MGTCACEWVSECECEREQECEGCLCLSDETKFRKCAEHCAWYGRDKTERARREREGERESVCVGGGSHKTRKSDFSMTTECHASHRKPF